MHPWMKEKLDVLKLIESRNPNCTCPFNFDLNHFNNVRCRVISPLHRTCYIPPTTTTTTTTTTAPTTTTRTTHIFTTHLTSPQIPSSGRTGKTTDRTTKNTIHTSGTTKYSTGRESSTLQTEVQLETTGYTQMPSTTQPVPPHIIVGGVSLSSSQKLTVIVIAVGAVVLIVFVLVGAVCFCR